MADPLRFLRFDPEKPMTWGNCEMNGFYRRKEGGPEMRFTGFDAVGRAIFVWDDERGRRRRVKLDCNAVQYVRGPDG